MKDLLEDLLVWLAGIAFNAVIVGIAALIFWVAIEVGLNMLNSPAAFVGIIIGFVLILDLIDELFL